MPAAVVKDGTVTPKFRQGKISPPFLTAKFSPRNSPLAKFSPPLYIIPAFWGRSWGEWLRNLCVLGSHEKGTKSEVATSSLPSGGPISGDSRESQDITPAFSGTQNWAELPLR